MLFPDRGGENLRQKHGAVCQSLEGEKLSAALKKIFFFTKKDLLSLAVWLLSFTKRGSREMAYRGGETGEQ
jgi:hypothetical protein